MNDTIKCSVTILHFWRSWKYRASSQFC